MFSRLIRNTLFAAAASLALSGPMAVAADEGLAARLADPECAALENSLLPAPDWYAAQCLGGKAVTDYSQYKEVPDLVPGDIAWYKINFPAPLDVRTAPLTTLTFTTVGANAAPLFAMTFNNAATTLYAIDNTTRQLGTINLTTGAFVPIAAINPDSGGTVLGLAFDPTSTTAYMSKANPVAGQPAQLFTINLTTAALGPAVNIGTIAFAIDIAIDRTGQMWSHDIALDNLLRVDKVTGAVTVVGPTGMNANFAQGMMYDNSDDTLYGCAFVIAPAQAGQLVRFNRTTGAATILAGPIPQEMECGVRVPAVRLTGTALAVDTAANRVMEPGETVVVAPSWRNDSSLLQTGVTGTFSAFAGPGGGTYTITDATAAYGDIAGGATATCTANCYGVMASGTPRPVQHWDTTVLETLSVAGQSKTWTLHIGESFTDVLSTNGFYRFVETLFHKGITGGCGANIYCPTASTTREQMSVFVLISKEGTGYAPPACAPPNLFSDVPDTSPFCRFIEELANRGVVTGCGPNLYCPTGAVTREQMAIFVLRTLDPALNPPACAPPNLFADVPETSVFCRWIEELANRGVVSGCGGNPPNYCPLDPVTREQMGVFLSSTFGLLLYGV